MVKDMNIPPRKFETDEIKNMTDDELWKHIIEINEDMQLYGVPDDTILTFLRLGEFLSLKYVFKEVYLKIKYTEIKWQE